MMPRAWIAWSAWNGSFTAGRAKQKRRAASAATGKERQRSPRHRASGRQFHYPPAATQPEQRGAPDLSGAVERFNSAAARWKKQVARLLAAQIAQKQKKPIE